MTEILSDGRGREAEKRRRTAILLLVPGGSCSSTLVLYEHPRTVWQKHGGSGRCKAWFRARWRFWKVGLGLSIVVLVPLICHFRDKLRACIDAFELVSWYLAEGLQASTGLGSIYVAATAADRSQDVFVFLEQEFPYGNLDIVSYTCACILGAVNRLSPRPHMSPTLFHSTA